MKKKIIRIVILMLIVVNIAFPAVATQDKIEINPQNEYKTLKIIDERPVIHIEAISGGRGVNAVLKNYGYGDATSVNWTIDLEGGFVLGERHYEGIIEEGMSSLEEVDISTGPIIGIGLINVNISCEWPYTQENKSGEIKWIYYNKPYYFLFFWYTYPLIVMNPHFFKPTRGWVTVDYWNVIGGEVYEIDFFHDKLDGKYDVRCVDDKGYELIILKIQFSKGAGSQIALSSYYWAVYADLVSLVNSGNAWWQVFIP